MTPTAGLAEGWAPRERFAPQKIPSLSGWWRISDGVVVAKCRRSAGDSESFWGMGRVVIDPDGGCFGFLQGDFLR